MKCIIIDDDRLSREVLSLKIFKSSQLILKESFENAIDAIKYLNCGNDIDLIFLDIHMPNFSGFDFIRTLKNPPQIIVVTVDKNFAIDAFNYNFITDYLLKPVYQDRFERAIERTMMNRNNIGNKNINEYKEANDIYINIDKRLIKIDILTIKYIHANGDYIIIKTETLNYTVHTTLKKISEKFIKYDFFLKIHRSYIINLKKIIDIQDSSVLIGLDVIPISKSYRAILIQSINLL